MRLFVYGSLRSGCGNHDMLAVPRRPAVTRASLRRGHGWALYEYAGGAYPVMIPTGGGAVVGELVDIEIESADWVIIEGMERGAGYHLTPLKVDIRSALGDLETHEVFTFAWFDADDDWIGPLVPDGDWVAHRARQRAALGMTTEQQSRSAAEARAYRDARL